MQYGLSADGTLYRARSRAAGEGFALPVEQGRLVIPAGVRAIDDWTFSYRRDLREIVFPEGLEAIGSWAFRSCRNLQSLRLPEGLVTLGQAAFAGCTELRSLFLPDSLAGVPACAFHGCRRLREIRFPDALRSVGPMAFRSCEDLRSLCLPEGLVTLGQAAFAGCTELRSVRLPDSLAGLPDHLFQGCRRLREVRFPAALTAIGRSAFDGRFLLNLTRQPFADGRGPVLWLPGGSPSAEQGSEGPAFTLKVNSGARETAVDAGGGQELQLLWPGSPAVLPQPLRNPALRGFLRAERAGDRRLADWTEDYAKHCRADRTLQLALLDEDMGNLEVMTRCRMISRGAMSTVQKKVLQGEDPGPAAIWLDYLLREGLLTAGLLRTLMDRTDSTSLNALYLEYMHRLPPGADETETL